MKFLLIYVSFFVITAFLSIITEKGAMRALWCRVRGFVGASKNDQVMAPPTDDTKTL